MEGEQCAGWHAAISIAAGALLDDYLSRWHNCCDMCVIVALGGWKTDPSTARMALQQQEERQLATGLPDAVACSAWALPVQARHWRKQGQACRQPAYLKGASPVPGPTMMIGQERDGGRRKSGFLWMYTGTLWPTCRPDA